MYACFMIFLKNEKILIFSKILIFFILLIFLINCVFISFTKNNDNSLNSGILINKIHINEDQYGDIMVNEVEPYLNKLLDKGFFKGIEDEDIYYENYILNESKGNIVISHGYTESLDKYHEIIYYFLKAGFNVFGIEHRGHGRSGSLGIDDISQMYVENYEDYISDFKKFMDTVVLPYRNSKKIFLFSHSMGGGIGVRFIELYPNYFDAAVLSAPMLSLNTGSVPNFIAHALAKAAIALNRGNVYVIGFTKYSPEEDMDKWATSSEVRHRYYDNYVEKNIEFQKGGATYKWLNEALELCIETTKKKNIEKVKIPILLCESGNDIYVTPRGERKFERYAANCKLIKFETSRHEIYREVDKIQIPYLINVLNFYKENM